MFLLGRQRRHGRGYVLDVVAVAGYKAAHTVWPERRDDAGGAPAPVVADQGGALDRTARPSDRADRAPAPPAGRSAWSRPKGIASARSRADRARRPGSRRPRARPPSRRSSADRKESRAGGSRRRRPAGRALRRRSPAAASLRAGPKCLPGDQPWRAGPPRLPDAGVRHGRPRLLRGKGVAFLQKLDGNVVGRPDECHVAVARRTVDRHAAVHQPLAGLVDVVDLVGEMAEIAAARVGLGIPVECEFQFRRAARRRMQPCPSARRGR